MSFDLCCDAHDRGCQLHRFNKGFRCILSWILTDVQCCLLSAISMLKVHVMAAVSIVLIPLQRYECDMQ